MVLNICRLQSRFFKHFSFWIIITLYVIVNEGWKSKDVFTLVPEPELLSLIPIAMLLCYFNTLVLMPRYYFSENYLCYIISFVFLLLLGGALQRFFSYILWIPLGKMYDPLSYHADINYYWNTVRIFRNSFLFFSIIIVHMLLKIMQVALGKERRLREVEEEKRIAELNLLKAQINPHFFFNTLNSLYALTLKGSSQSPQVVLRLSDLMHYMLYEASANTVLLKNEIQHLESYIYIEKLRFSNRLDIFFQYSGDIENKTIYPLLLLPFIENAFKHGLTKEVGWITISINVTDKELFLKVENSFSEESDSRKNGLGLVNVKKRLDLLYGDDYILVLNKINGIFEAELKIRV
ncbi:histidine kinase [Sphingobacterium kitahiroshimense]|uniref:sensor histidine kinase n=1 Tax=Sphingobacterium sp. B16(2022) TaxID=2914044 RepID=UPI00143C3189|nr:histidine kinase [Sphingobacterium sp. B16(2022)]NJI71989.1 histidine kinase [Sphingobacterium sp. B16(2022)]